MITHDMLAEAIFRASYFEPCFRCQNLKPNCDKCCYNMVTEYENSVRADEMRVFREWFKGSKYFLGFPNMDEVIEEFEKQMKGE